MCPRKRLPDGGIDIIRNDTVKTVLAEFDDIIQTWGVLKPDLDYSIHISAGILKFLLPIEELRELIDQTYPKFWLAATGYKHQLGGTPVTIGRKNGQD